jgi:hypothetical protein
MLLDESSKIPIPFPIPQPRWRAGVLGAVTGSVFTFLKRNTFINEADFGGFPKSPVPHLRASSPMWDTRES